MPDKVPLMQRHLRLPALIAVIVFAVALAWGLSQLLPNKNDDEPTAQSTATPAATPCTDVAKPYGDAPDGFAYEKVDEATRVKTVKALNLDEAGGRVDMRKATRGGLELGSIVGVPSKDPADYASSLVAAAQGGGAKITKGNGYLIIPLASGQNVAVGVRGCKTILISSQDPNGTKYLAENVFSAPAG
jgi:hypothetical protein